MSHPGWTMKEEKEYAMMNWKAHNEFVKSVATKAANMPRLSSGIIYQMAVYAACGPESTLLLDAIIIWINEVVADGLRRIEEEAIKKLRAEMALHAGYDYTYYDLDPVDDDDDEYMFQEYNWTEHSLGDS